MLRERIIPAGRSARAAAPVFLAILAVGILMATLITAADSTMELTPPQEPIPASYFDLNIVFYPGARVPWPPVPFYSWRLSHANWFELEPQKGQWNFDHLDQLVGWAQEHHAEILMTLEYPPKWASRNPDAPGDWGAGATGPVRDVEDWRTFVRTVATRYKGRINTYELWNEPDRQRSWTGDMGSMVEMARVAYETLKQVDPGITVVSPSATYGKGPAWLADFLQKGGVRCVDVIGYHFYTGGTDSMGPPESVVPLIQEVRRVMAQSGAGDKPLWNTESGWLGSESYSGDKAAAYVARAFVLNWAAGVSRYYYFGWDPHKQINIEMVKSDNATLLPAADAFATIQQWLTGTVMKHVWTSSNKNWVVQINRGGNDEYIVWNEQGNQEFRLSQNWRVTKVTQLSGGTNAIHGDSIQIGIQPVLIQ